jgi:hypothetical protein
MKEGCERGRDEMRNLASFLLCVSDRLALPFRRRLDLRRVASHDLSILKSSG